MSRDLPFSDAIGVCGMLVGLGRAVPPAEWVDFLVAQKQIDMLEGLF